MIGRLEGFEAPLGAWEHDLLPARLAYEPEDLDRLTACGEVVWGRLDPPKMTEDSRGKMLTRATPISLVQRPIWPGFCLRNVKYQSASQGGTLKRYTWD